MTQTTMTVRLNSELSDFVTTNVGNNGDYENVSEYIRNLIRQDKERAEQQKFERLKAEITLAFSAPETTYSPVTAADIINRNKP